MCRQVVHINVDQYHNIYWFRSLNEGERLNLKSQAANKKIQYICQTKVEMNPRLLLHSMANHASREQILQFLEMLS